MMKLKLLGTGLAAMTLLATALSAQAADIPRPIYKGVQPVVAYYNWTGFYLGINGGYGWGTSTWSLLPGTKISPNGFLVGGTIGYNYQVNRWVFGAEADLSLSSKSGVHGSSINLLNPLFTVGTSEKTLATLRGRVGYAWDRFMVYGTAGVALAQVEAQDLGALTSGSETKTMVGFAGGAGIEYAFLNNWSVKAEYIYVDLGSATFLQNSDPLGLPHEVSLTNQLFRVGVNYKFGSPLMSRF